MTSSTPAIAVPTGRGARARRWASRHRIRAIVALVVALAVVGFVGFTGYAVVAGSDDLLHPYRSPDCRTPAVQYGWAYEAINYDPASDRTLAPRFDEDTKAWVCDRPAGPALGAVVTSDGIHLAGWYIPAASGAGPTGPTILLVPGRSSNKSAYLRYGQGLHAVFNLVVFDLRGTGQSDDAPVTLGVLEQRDVEAAIDWLVAAKHPGWIAAVGTSMGGAAALAAAATDTRIRALVLDSMHARIAATIGNGIESDRHRPAFPTQPAAFFGAWLRTGVDLSSADPIDTIARVQGRPILLTHGSEDAYDRPADSVLANLHAGLQAGALVDIRICPGAGHDEVVDRCRAQWADWVTSFFAAALRS